jgi:hypothetical protein
MVRRRIDAAAEAKGVGEAFDAGGAAAVTTLTPKQASNGCQDALSDKPDATQRTV